MKISKLFLFVVVALLVTSCLLTKPNSQVTPTPSPYVTVTMAPTPISWPELREGWTRFSRDFDGVALLGYDPAGYFWTNGDHGLIRWNIDTGEANAITYDNGLPFAGSVKIFDGKTWLINTSSGEFAYYSDGEWIRSPSIPYKLGNLSDSSFLYNQTISDTGDRLWVIGEYTDYSKCPTTPGIIPPSCISRYSGIYYFNGQAWKVFNRMPDQYADYSYSVAKSKDGSFWFWNGSHVLEHDGNVWREHKNLRGARVVTLTDGGLLFVFDTLIISFDGENLAPLVFPENKYYYPIEKSYFTPEGDFLVKLRDYYNDSDLLKNSTYLIHDGQIKETPDLKFADVPDDRIDLSYQLATPRGWIFRFPNGFYLYDGKNWKKFEKPNSSPIYQAMGGSTLGFAPDGSLWLVDEKGIKRFDGRKRDYIFEGNQCPYILSSSSEESMEYRMDVAGNIWGGSSEDNLLCYFDVKTKEVSIFELAFNINKFALAPNGSVWATSDEGYIANFTLDFLKKDPHQKVDLIKIGGDAVYYRLHPLRIEVGFDGAVWVFAEDSGLHRYEGKDWKYYGLSDLQEPSAFAIDAKGQVWAGLTDKLLKHDGVTWAEYPIEKEFNRQVFPSHMVMGLDGAVWFVNNSSYIGNKSAYRFDGSKWSHFAEVYPDTSFIEKIIFAPDGAVWFTSYFRWARYKP